MHKCPHCGQTCDCDDSAVFRITPPDDCFHSECPYLEYDEHGYPDHFDSSPIVEGDDIEAVVDDEDDER